MATPQKPSCLATQGWCKTALPFRQNSFQFALLPKAPTQISNICTPPPRHTPQASEFTIPAPQSQVSYL